MHIWGKVCFFIVSQDAHKLADIRVAAERNGWLWKAQQQDSRCVGLSASGEQVAELLADLCFGVWEQRWLAALAQQRYDCFSRQELRLMLDKALCLTQEDNFCWGLFAGENRQERLCTALAEQLRYCPHLNVDGFWRFRMEGYREYLQTLLSITADEVLCEQENGQYLRLLTGFMQAQPSGGEAHVFLLRQGYYDICLKAGDNLRFVEGGRLNGCEDVLLYALLQLAPQQLFVHAEQPLPSALQHLLVEVFGARLRLSIFCAGTIDKRLPQ